MYLSYAQKKYLRSYYALYNMYLTYVHKLYIRYIITFLLMKSTQWVYFIYYRVFIKQIYFKNLTKCEQNRQRKVLEKVET